MDIFDALTKKLNDQKQMLVSALAQGTAKDFADYQHLCGRIRGIADAQMEITDLSRTLKENDDD